MRPASSVIPATIVTLSFSLLATAATITGFRPGVNVDGISSWTYNPINPDGSFKPEWYNPLFGGGGQKGLNPKVVRFMDWNQTNGNQSVNWSDRQTSNVNPWYGVPYETQIKLVNQSNTIPWVNMPVMATSDYAYQMGKLWGSQYKGSTIKWEYSNELWNGGDQNQGTWNMRQAAAEGYSGPSDTERMAQRAAWVGYQRFQDFKRGLADAGYKGKAEWEWGGFVPNQYWTMWGMEELKRRGVNPANVGIRLAVAPYAPGSETDVDIQAGDSFQTGANKIRGFINNYVIPWIRANKSTAASYGLLGVDSYEARAGSSYTINKTYLGDWWIKFNYDPAAFTLQQDYWTMLNAEMGPDSTSNAFGFYGIPWSQWGQWTLLNTEQLSNPNSSYNYAGLQSMIDYGPTAPTPVPEPIGLAPLALLMGLAAVRRRRRQA